MNGASVVWSTFIVTGGSVELERMPLNTSWSKFQYMEMNALTSSFLYAAPYFTYPRLLFHLVLKNKEKPWKSINVGQTRL
jgi:hypothetical protein